MTAGLCVCVLLAVLCTSCLGLPVSTPPHEEGHRSVSDPAEAHPGTAMHTFEEPHPRHKRSVSHLKSVPADDEEADSRANLSELLARIISSRKGSVRRNSTANSRSNALSANHRIADRDYLGWMDFGRRSAEEYEYPS
ncbi:cholecystokinin [Periophthalmus magnuspinnatus]|uniref:Gastrin/cholecystokinin peptide hormone domain-containing protein n=1 Tax=Periophthalmus magnuspinnatus TaxID=409849 RepID=A0A3B4AVG0_9GOBI|nr:cholecystokinin [Periophthalmus magnuspinnatus]